MGDLWSCRCSWIFPYDKHTFFKLKFQHSKCTYFTNSLKRNGKLCTWFDTLELSCSFSLYWKIIPSQMGSHGLPWSTFIDPHCDGIQIQIINWIYQTLLKLTHLEICSTAHHHPRGLTEVPPGDLPEDLPWYKQRLQQQQPEQRISPSEGVSRKEKRKRIWKIVFTISELVQ